ncbi:class I SAM-dependent methyltransferase [Streptomyces sp. NPDC088775]|uniref:class I SAM-dependent methyltransferase n=1 Tax=Streptomyces sp. NPDC088775 TaxID=3365896 RepID=UPI003811B141
MKDVSSMEGLAKEVANLRKGMDNGFRQMEALVNLHGIVPVGHVMPTPTSWAASPDFLLYLVSQVQERRPNSILDLGSGVTTIWMANAIRHFGIPGRVVAIDHDNDFGEATAAALRRQGLSAYAEVRIAQLTELSINEEQWRWYDPTEMGDIEMCDLLVIDGPPGYVHPLSRYPALPILVSKLSDGAQILLDDASRSDEQIIVERWLREYPDWRADLIDHKKGTAILTRSR